MGENGVEQKGRRQRKKTIKYRLFLIGASICLLPVLLIGTWQIWKNTQRLEEEERRQEIDYLEKGARQLEAYMSFCEAYYTSASAQSVLEHYLYYPLNYREYSSLSQVTHLLEDYLIQQDLFAQVMFVNFRDNFIIGNSNICYYDPSDQEYLKSILSQTETESKTVFWTFIQPWDGLRATGTIQNKRITFDGITLVIKCPLSSSVRHAAIFVTLDDAKMDAVFSRPQYDEKHPLMIISGNRIIYHEDPAMVGKSADEIPGWDQLDLSGRSGAQTVSDGNSKQFVSYFRGEKGWIYLTENPDKTMEGIYREIFVSALLLVVIALLLITAMIVLLSRNVYTPIYQAASRMQKIGNLETENRNELQILNDGLDSITKQQEEMRHQLELFQGSLKEAFFTRLIRRRLWKAEDIRAEAQSLKLEMTDPLLAVMVIQYTGSSSSASDELDIYKSFQELYLRLPLESVVMKTVYQEMLVVLLGSSLEQREFISFLCKTGEGLLGSSSQEPHDICIGISNPVTTLEEVPEAYMESVAALTCRTSMKRNILLAPVEEEMNKGTNGYPGALCDQLMFAIRNGNREEAAAFLRQVADQIFGTPRTVKIYEAYMLRAAARIAALTEETNPFGMQAYGSFPDHLYEQMMKIHDADVMYCFFWKKMAVPLMDWIAEKTADTRQRLSKQVIERIRTGFDTDLTLEQMAEELHMHPTYLWQAFKEETGTTYAQYLEDYRFSMAKKWLLESDRTVAEIAASLQYSNPQNFIRSFKKKMGITPGQYRQQAATGSTPEE